MIKRFAILLYVVSALFFATLCGCTSADDVVFNEPENTDYVRIQAFVAHTMDSISTMAKADTVKPGDSLIFLSTVFPSKSIRSQDYFWTIDGNAFSYEYNFRRALYQPGRHQINFVFVDFFGDTLKDTVHLYIASSPILDSTTFIPARGMQNVQPSDFVRFAWNARDPDNMWEIAHRFQLREAKGYYEHPKILVDTILKEANFTYYKGLDPLSHYEWEVSLQNELGQVSENSLCGNFNTQGVDGENAVFAFISHTSTDNELPVHVVLKNVANEIVYEEIRSNAKNQSYAIKPLVDGKYKLTASIKDQYDFPSVTKEFSISGNTILTLDSILLKDTTPPRISALDGSDTVAFADTLKILLTDKGGKIVDTRIKIQLEAQSIPDFTLSNDTLLVYIPELKTSWTYKILTISAYDQSGNKNQKNLYITPATTLPEVFGE
ncbi:MAG: hypothetical protein MJZ05_11130 [Fibrobacter sp.]|nr:hypothetical protein [Fibrobacter sp.]